MSNEADCRTAPATPGLLNTLQEVPLSHLSKYAKFLFFETSHSGKSLLKEKLYWYRHYKVVRIIQTNCIDHTFNFVLKHTEAVVLYPNFIEGSPLPWSSLKKNIYKSSYGKYIQYATPGNYVACLGEEVFQFP